MIPTRKDALAHDAIAKYPPKPPQSTYRRTGRLGRSWKTQVYAKKALVGTSIKYAPYVQVSATQASFHKRTGWVTIEQVAKAIEPKARQIIAQAIDKITRGAK